MRTCTNGGRDERTKGRSPSSSFRRLVVSSALLFLLLAGCDTSEPATGDDQIVVEGYLVAGEALPTIWVRRTARLTDQYDFGRFAVRGAEVRVDRLRGEVGIVDESYLFSEGSSGAYVFDGASTVVPGGVYRLEVRVPGAPQLITARTVVPDSFSVLAASADTIQLGRAQLELKLTRSQNPQRQSFFKLDVASLDARQEQLTPFGRGLFDSGVSLVNLSVMELPVLNEANYLNPNGTLTVPMLWLLAAFYGPNVFTVSALDDNLYDLIRSVEAQQDGTSFLPGEIPEVVEHVEGGTGVFGSLARVRHPVFVQRP